MQEKSESGGRQSSRHLNEAERSLQIATAAYFSALGYYVATDFELPQGYRRTIVDVVGIKPIIRELKKRSRLGPAPAGILHLLDTEEWTPTETIIDKSNGGTDFVRAVLMESEEKGWVEKNVVKEDEVHWRLKDYRDPARDAFIARCSSTSPIKALEDLQTVADCCHCLYLILGYEVDSEFLDRCLQSGVGVMVYVFRNGYFRELLPVENRAIKDRRGYMALGERVLFEHYIMRQQDWF